MMHATMLVKRGFLCGHVRHEAKVFLHNEYICHCSICQCRTGQLAGITVLIKSGRLLAMWPWVGHQWQVCAKGHLMNRICHIEIDQKGLARPTPEIEQERQVAIFDLLEDNFFVLPVRDGREVQPGPYRLGLAIREGRLVFSLATEAEAPAGEFHLSLGPFRQVVKDYFQICESYFEAVKRLPPSQIEAIDMARRGIHNEGALVLQERLEGKAEVDIETARRLFTLICVLHWG